MSVYSKKKKEEEGLVRIDEYIKSGLAELGSHLIRLFKDLGVVQIQRVVHPDDLGVGQFQTVFEHTREEI